MKVGQTLRSWWQDYLAGRLRTPQAIVRAASADFQSADARSSERFLDLPPDALHWDAPARLCARGFLDTTPYLTQMHKADWQQCDPRLMRWAALFCELARKRGVPLYVHSAFRTEAQQAALVAKGHSKTPYPRSAHNNGEAVDIVHGVFHWTLTKQEWALLGVLGRLALDRVNSSIHRPKRLPSGVNPLHYEKLALDWGGDWSFYDPAHWQISTYRARIKRRPVLPPVRLTPRAILTKYKA